MSAAFFVFSDMCADHPRPGEQRFLRFPEMDYLDNILYYYKNNKSELKKHSELIDPKNGTIHHKFEMKGVMGKTIYFYIYPYRENYMFGWSFEECLQERSWHYIVNDIIHTFRSGFY